MSVAEMAISLFAVNEGYIDDVEAGKVVDFESALQSFMKSEYAELINSMNESKDYSDEVQESLNQALQAFKDKGSW